MREKRVSRILEMEGCQAINLFGKLSDIKVGYHIPYRAEPQLMQYWGMVNQGKATLKKWKVAVPRTHMGMEILPISNTQTGKSQG